MDPLSMFLGALNMGGSMFGQFQSQGFNSAQAQMNRDFQERMSSTAHQREVSDLMKAGLNPILSVTHGGSSTPSGSSAQSASFNPASEAVSSAISAQRMSQEKEVQNAEISQKQQAVDQSKAETRKTDRETKFVDVMEQEAKQRIQHSAKGMEHVDAQIGMLDQQIAEATAKGNKARLEILNQQKSTLFRILMGAESFGGQLGRAVTSPLKGAVKGLFE